MKKVFGRLSIRKKLTCLILIHASLMTGLVFVSLLAGKCGYLRVNLFGEFFAILFLSCTGALFLFLCFDKIIIKPVLELAEMMNRVSEQKDFSATPVQTPGDEIRILSEGFNGMLTKIKTGDREVEMYRNHLEEMVKQRTAELEQSLAEMKTAKEDAETACIPPADSQPHLPDKPENSQESAEVSALSCKPVSGSLRVLLVEDNPVSRFVGQKILEHLRCRVDTASDGMHALEMFFRAEYDIVFMDCEMPKMDGYTAAQEIRKYESQLPPRGRIPIIALTAHALEEDQMQCLAAGMDDFITKPFLPEQLESALKKWRPCEKGESGTISEADDRKEADALSAENAVFTADTEIQTAVDMGVLDNIRSLQREGMPDILKKVLSHYLEHTPDLLKKLERAVQEGNGKAMSDTAHSMKSASGNVGAMPLFELCRKMEAIGRGRASEGSSDTAGSIFTEIRSEYEKVRIFLQKEMERQTK